MSLAVCLHLAPLNLWPGQSCDPGERPAWQLPGDSVAVVDPRALIPWRTAWVLNRLVRCHLNNRFQSFAFFQNRARASYDKDGAMATGCARDWQAASAARVPGATSPSQSQLLRLQSVVKSHDTCHTILNKCCGVIREKKAFPCGNHGITSFLIVW